MKAKYLDTNINVRVPVELRDYYADVAESKSMGLSSYVRSMMQKEYDRNVSKKPTPAKKGK